MTDAITNSAPAESASAPPSFTLDDAAHLDFEESQEDETNGETSTAQTDADEANQGDTTTEVDPDAEPGEDEPSGDEATANDDPDDAIHALPSGEQVSLKELKLGYMKEADYRRKSQANGNRARELETATQRVAGTATAIAEFLASQLPEEPPRSLAIQDPVEYTRQKAIFDGGMEQLQAILSLADAPKDVAKGLSDKQLDEKLATENELLLGALPHLKKDEERQKFFASAFKAAEEFGYTPEELQDRTDHRDFMVMHWALKGLEADRARVKAMQKVDNAPVMPAKGKANGKAAQQARKSTDAMKRLENTGSIKDAMSIDFD